MDQCLEWGSLRPGRRASSGADPKCKCQSWGGRRDVTHKLGGFGPIGRTCLIRGRPSRPDLSVTQSSGSDSASWLVPGGPTHGTAASLGCWRPCFPEGVLEVPRPPSGPITATCSCPRTRGMWPGKQGSQGRSAKTWTSQREPSLRPQVKPGPWLPALPRAEGFPACPPSCPPWQLREGGSGASTSRTGHHSCRLCCLGFGFTGRGEAAGSRRLSVGAGGGWGYVGEPTRHACKPFAAQGLPTES